MFDTMKSKTTDTVELCKISWYQGKHLHRMKRYPKAMKCFEFIIKESEKDIKPVEVDKFAYKAHQKVAQMMFEILCFKTAFEHLTKAEQLLKDLQNYK